MSDKTKTQEQRIVKQVLPRPKKEWQRNIRDDYVFTKIMPSWRNADVELKSPAYVKAFLQRRKQSKNYYSQQTKYELCKEAYLEMRRVMNECDVLKFEQTVWRLKDAMKYQGYLQMHQVIAELSIEGLTDEQVKALWLGEKL